MKLNRLIDLTIYLFVAGWIVSGLLFGGLGLSVW